MNSLIVIPARGGSKGIPKKNIKKLCGKPLIFYTLEEAIKLFSEKHICVSTDSIDIIDKVKELGLEVPYKRPSNLASDSSGMREVLLDSLLFYSNLNKIEYDNIILLQPTSPFRQSIHIEEALNIYSQEIDMVVSVTEAKGNPYYNLFEENERGYLDLSKPSSFIRRQDCPKVWEYNGAIYIINVKSLLKHNSLQFNKVVRYQMLAEHSVDLDTLYDWRLAEFLMCNNT